jgi:ribosomal protein S18 acetylase RimI-like enzyme
MHNNFIIREAVKTDAINVDHFLDRAMCVHRHLDWRTVTDRILDSPFLLMENDSGIIALLSCPLEDSDLAWILCHAQKRHAEFNVWQELLSNLRNFPVLKNKQIFTIGLQEWYINLLRKSGFNEKQRVVVLLYNRSVPLLKEQNGKVFLRRMSVADFEAVWMIDHLAFAPQWTLSRNSLPFAFQQSALASVAMIENNIIGYAISTANPFSAHLARLAVHPNFTREHIGTLLTNEMIRYFSAKGINQISVNTQSDNLASLSLYKKLGFRLTGESFPVFNLF